MIKRIVVYTLIMVLVIGASCYIHQLILENKGLALSFDLWHVYGLNLLLTFCTYVILSIASTKMPDQVGNLFLVSVMVKPGVLLMVFGQAVFGAESFKMFERLAIVIPFLLSLLAEVISIHGILKSLGQSTISGGQKD